MSTDPTIPECPDSDPALDPESAAWVQALGASGPAHDEAVSRLHDLLLRVAGTEARRRSGRLPIAGTEVDDRLLAAIAGPDGTAPLEQ